MPAGRAARLAAAGVLALAAPLILGAGAPDPSFAWTVNQEGASVFLVYGSTETGEDYAFALSCNNKKMTTGLTVYQDIPGAQVGQAITIELSAGAAMVALKGKTETDEMSGYVFGVAKKFEVKPVIAVLAAKGPAVAKMGKVTVDLPENGRAAAVSEFAKACRLD
jgi:hypothetical protein